MKRDLSDNRGEVIRAAIDLLKEFDYDTAANKLQKAHESSSCRIELICGNTDDRNIAEAFRACGLGHAYLTDSGVMYIIK